MAINVTGTFNALRLASMAMLSNEPSARTASAACA